MWRTSSPRLHHLEGSGDHHPSYHLEILIIHHPGRRRRRRHALALEQTLII